MPISAGKAKGKVPFGKGKASRGKGTYRPLHALDAELDDSAWYDEDADPEDAFHSNDHDDYAACAIYEEYLLDAEFTPYEEGEPEDSSNSA